MFFTFTCGRALIMRKTPLKQSSGSKVNGNCDFEANIDAS